MFDVFDRYSLALAVLNGEENAHKILADMLEDQGDRGLAQWARARKGNRAKRLDFVLATMPHMTTLRLGCNFFEHSFHGSGNYSSYRTQFASVAPKEVQTSIAEIIAIENWAKSDRHLDVPIFKPDVLWTSATLRSATQLANEAIALEQAQETRKAHARAVESQVLIRREAKACRIGHKVTRVGGYSDEMAENVGELNWQFRHTQSVLNELLENHV